MEDCAAFPRSLRSPRAAGRWAAAWCHANGGPGEVDALELVVSELVSNAVHHGSGEVCVTLAHHGDRLVRSVRDEDPHAFFVDPRAEDDIGGWGLSIVAHLT